MRPLGKGQTLQFFGPHSHNILSPPTHRLDQSSHADWNGQGLYWRPSRQDVSRGRRGGPLSGCLGTPLRCGSHFCRGLLGLRHWTTRYSAILSLPRQSRTVLGTIVFGRRIFGHSGHGAHDTLGTIESVDAGAQGPVLVLVGLFSTNLCPRGSAQHVSWYGLNLMARYTRQCGLVWHV